MHKKIWICFLIMACTLIILTVACKKKSNDNNNNNNNNPPATTVTDYDGNVYNTVTIGTQVWMKTNLKVTHYRNGDAIPIVTTGNQWSALTTGAYCNYNFDAGNVATYGSLYNWYAVSDTRNLAPNGWHIPSDAEWTVLTDYLGGETVAGGKMKEAGTTHWASPNTSADNSSGFTALPGGYCIPTGYSLGLDACCYFWSSTINTTSSLPYFRSIFSDDGAVTRYYYDFRYGYSIRCIKD